MIHVIMMVETRAKSLYVICKNVNHMTLKKSTYYSYTREKEQLNKKAMLLDFSKKSLKKDSQPWEMYILKRSRMQFMNVTKKMNLLTAFNWCSDRLVQPLSTSNKFH